MSSTSSSSDDDDDDDSDKIKKKLTSYDVIELFDVIIDDKDERIWKIKKFFETFEFDVDEAFDLPVNRFQSGSKGTTLSLPPSNLSQNLFISLSYSLKILNPDAFSYSVYQNDLDSLRGEVWACQ